MLLVTRCKFTDKKLFSVKLHLLVNYVQWNRDWKENIQSFDITFLNILFNRSSTEFSFHKIAIHSIHTKMASEQSSTHTKSYRPFPCFVSCWADIPSFNKASQQMNQSHSIIFTNWFLAGSLELERQRTPRRSFPTLQWLAQGRRRKRAKKYPLRTRLFKQIQF